MKTKETKRGKQIDIDQEGYLVNAETWTEVDAGFLAKEEVPEGLTDDHWKVIEAMRHYYLEMGTVPPVRMLSRKTGLSLREMQRLFPSGLSKGACKIAGIPKSVVKPSFLYP